MVLWRRNRGQQNLKPVTGFSSRSDPRLEADGADLHWFVARHDLEQRHLQVLGVVSSVRAIAHRQVLRSRMRGRSPAIDSCQPEWHPDQMAEQMAVNHTIQYLVAVPVAALNVHEFQSRYW